MTAQQGNPDQKAGPGQTPGPGGPQQNADSERDGAHAAGSPATTEAAAGIPQQAGRVEESTETPVKDEDLAGKDEPQPGGDEPSEVEKPDRIEEHPEDQNSG